MAKTPEEMAASMIANLEEKTGKNLAGWLEITQASGLAKRTTYEWQVRAVNGNGDTWTQYSVNFNSGSNTQISVGFKLGSSPSGGPSVKWDTLRIE